MPGKIHSPRAVASCGLLRHVGAVIVETRRDRQTTAAGCRSFPWPIPALLAVAALLATLACPAIVQAQIPEDAVRVFCQRDGHGDRLRSGTWPSIGELVTWRLEPAWDRVVLISGYRIGGVVRDGDQAEMEITYASVAEVTPQGISDVSGPDIVKVHLVRRGNAWRLLDPPPPPHVFENLVDRDDMAASMAPENATFVSDSVFIWRMFRQAGWDLSFEPVAHLLDPGTFFPVAEPRVGDVVAYVHNGVPYHAGIYEGEDSVVSATINRGIMRTRLSAFAGDLRYLRLGDVARLGAATPGAEGSPAATAEEAAARLRAAGTPGAENPEVAAPPPSSRATPSPAPSPTGAAQSPQESR